MCLLRGRNWIFKYKTGKYQRLNGLNTCIEVIGNNCNRIAVDRLLKELFQEEIKYIKYIPLPLNAVW